MPGEFWIGTDNGLFIRRENEIYDGEAFHDDATPASISANLITSIDKDLSGNMWVGTFYTGINIWKDMRDEMTILFRNPTGNSIKGEVIRRISTDSDGVIWFCSEDGWLGCIDPKTRKTGNWNLAGNLNMHDMIMDEDMIWLCSYGDGLYVFDLKKKKLIRKYDLPDNTLSAGIKLSSGDMLIGSVSGLYLYDTENDGFTTIEDLEGYDIHCLYEDSMGTVWIGTYGQGIICLDQDFRIVARYEADEASNGLTSKLITSFFEDSKRRMWVTTEGGGVCLTEPEFSRDKIRFRSITMENGIPSNVTCTTRPIGSLSACGSRSPDVCCQSESSYTIFLLRTTTHTTMGMPSSAVMVLTGSVSSFDTMSHTSSATAPVSAAAGSSVRWSASQKSMRATWGMARPIKPIGPQKAVTVPASRVVESSMSERVRRILTPIVRA